MGELGRALSDADLSYLIRIVAPQAQDAERLRRALREDNDILAGMLRDARLGKHLFTDTDRVIAASPRLFFAALLVKVKDDLERTTYTVEKEDRHRAAVFDSREVAGLMSRSDILAYLVGMLAAFLKIRTQSFVVRLRKGMWQRVEYNDMDLDSLLGYGERAGPEEVFSLWRRIGDVCLFRSGFYTPAQGPQAGGTSGKGRRAERRTRGELAEIGRHYYDMASRRHEAQLLSISEALSELAARFDMAVKPLDLLASRYLDALRERIFVP